MFEYGFEVIPARKKAWFCALFAWHVRRRIRAHFSAVYVNGLPSLRAATAKGPVILFANHTAWWDSLLLFDLCFAQLGLDGYAMMRADNLERFPFLGWIGGFGVDPTSREDGHAALAYASRQLDRPLRLVALFPQGEETAMSDQPPRLKPGVARLASMTPQATVLPMTFRYEHGRDEAPFALLTIGEPLADRSLQGCSAALHAQMQVAAAALQSADFRHWPTPHLRRSSRWLGR